MPSPKKKKCELTSNVITNVLKHNILNSKRVRRPVIKFCELPATSQAQIVEQQHANSAETIESPSKIGKKLSSCELASGSHAAIEPEATETVQKALPTPEQSHKRKKNIKESMQTHKKRKLLTSQQIHEEMCQERVLSAPEQHNMPIPIRESVQKKMQSSIDQQSPIDQQSHPEDQEVVSKIETLEDQSVPTKNKIKIKKYALQHPKKMKKKNQEPEPQVQVANQINRKSKLLSNKEKKTLMQPLPNYDATTLLETIPSIKSKTQPKKNKKILLQHSAEATVRSPDNKTTPAKKKTKYVFQQPPDEHNPSEPTFQTPVENTSTVKGILPAKKKRKSVFQEPPEEHNPSEPIFQTPVQITKKVKSVIPAKKKRKSVYQQPPEEHNPSEPTSQTPVQITKKVKSIIPAKKKREYVFQQPPEEHNTSEPTFKTPVENTSTVKSMIPAKKKIKSVFQQPPVEHNPSEPTFKTPVENTSALKSVLPAKKKIKSVFQQPHEEHNPSEPTFQTPVGNTSTVKSILPAKKKRKPVLQEPSIAVSSELKGHPPKDGTLPEQLTITKKVRKPSWSKTESKKLSRKNTVKRATKFPNPNPATIIKLKIKPYADWSTAVQEVPAFPDLNRPKPSKQKSAKESNDKQNVNPAVAVILSPKKADECSDVTSLSTSTSWAIVAPIARPVSGVFTQPLDGKIPTVRLTRLRVRKEHPSPKISKPAVGSKSLATLSESSSGSSSSSSDSSSSDTSLEVVEQTREILGTPNSSEKYSDILNFPSLQLSECSDNAKGSFPDLMREIFGMMKENNNFSILSTEATYSNSTSPHAESSKVSTNINKIIDDDLRKIVAAKPNFKMSISNTNFNIDLKKSFSTKFESKISFNNKNRYSDLPKTVAAERNLKISFSNTNGELKSKKNIASVIEKLSHNRESQQSHVIQTNMKTTLQVNTKSNMAVQFKDNLLKNSSKNATVISVPIEVGKTHRNETKNSSENSDQRTLTTASVVKPAPPVQSTEAPSHFMLPQMPKTVPMDVEDVEATFSLNDKCRKSDMDEDVISLYAESIESCQWNSRQRQKFMCEKKNADSTSGPNDIDKPVAPAPSPAPPPVPVVRTPPAGAPTLDEVPSEGEESDGDREPSIVLATNVQFMFFDPAFTRSTLFSNICINNLLNKCTVGWCRHRHATLEQHLLRVKELHNICNRRNCIGEYLTMKGILMNNSNLFHQYAEIFMDCFITKNKMRFLLEVVMDFYRTGTYLAAMDRALAAISDVASLEKCLDILAYRLEDGRIFIHLLLKAISLSNSNHIHVCIKLLSIAGRLTEPIDICTALLLVKKACVAPPNVALVRATFFSVICKTAPFILGHKKVIEEFANVLKSFNLKIYKRLIGMVENYKTQAGEGQCDSESERPGTDLAESYSGKKMNVWNKGESSNAGLPPGRQQAPALMSVNTLRNNGPEHRFRISPDTTQYPSYTMNQPKVPTLLPFPPRPRHQFRPQWTPPRMWYNGPRHRFHKNSRY